MYLTDMASVLRNAGLKVVEVSGWKTRGVGPMQKAKGIMWHHTATPASAKGDYPSLRVVRDGRKDLPGPLCHLGVGRDGTWYVVAAGAANHAGTGSYKGIGTNNGNVTLIGIEVEHPGVSGHPWPGEQLESLRRGSGALAKAYKISHSKVIGHKEWTSRKIDPYGLNMSVERSHVKKYKQNPRRGDWWDTVNDKKFIQLVRKAIAESFKVKKLTDGSETDVRNLVQWTHKHVTDVKARVEQLEKNCGSCQKGCEK